MLHRFVAAVSNAFVGPMAPVAGPTSNFATGSDRLPASLRARTTMVAAPDRIVTPTSAFEPTEGPNAPLRINNNGGVWRQIFFNVYVLLHSFVKFLMYNMCSSTAVVAVLVALLAALDLSTYGSGFVPHPSVQYSTYSGLLFRALLRSRFFMGIIYNYTVRDARRLCIAQQGLPKLCCNFELGARYSSTCNCIF